MLRHKHVNETCIQDKEVSVSQAGCLTWQGKTQPDASTWSTLWVVMGREHILAAAAFLKLWDTVQNMKTL